MNNFCIFYVIRTGLWNNFYFDSVFGYCSKGTYKCKEIVVAIFKMSLKVHPQDKRCQELKFANGMDFKNNSVCLFGNRKNFYSFA